MKIKISRDSVCLADDINENSRIYQLDDNETYEELFTILKDDNFFPSVSGNNVVWVMTTGQYECVFSYFTKTNKFSMGLSEKHIIKICDYPYEAHLKYYSSPAKWKKKIYAMYNEDEYALWRDGWTNELNNCDETIK